MEAIKSAEVILFPIRWSHDQMKQTKQILQVPAPQITDTFISRVYISLKYFLGKSGAALNYVRKELNAPLSNYAK